MKFIAKILSKIEYKPGTWNGLKIGIFKVEYGKEEQIGEYERNYSSLFDTFFPFRQNGKDFALYSPDYTVTRIMELPSCKDIGGEEPDSWGFCPVDYFVPAYIEQEASSVRAGSSGTDEPRVRKKIVNNPTSEALSVFFRKEPYFNSETSEMYESVTTYRPVTPLFYRPFGFVAGCIWGDDSSWKIQYLDLSEAEKGKLRRDERFGYIELPQNQNLKDVVDMSTFGFDDDDYSNYARMNIIQTFDLRNGDIVHP